MLSRTQDIARIESVEAAISAAVADSMTGLDCITASDRPNLWMDPQEQMEADLLQYGEDEIADPAYWDWCIPAKLRSEFGDPDLGARYLKENDDYKEIGEDIHAAIYLTDAQLENRHDRILMDVTKDGHRKGGTHGVAPEKRRSRNAKIVNSQLLPTQLVQIPGEDDVHARDRLERAEAVDFQISTAAHISRYSAYCLRFYKGKYRNVLELLLQGKGTLEIAQTIGKTDRRIRQIVNGNVAKGRKPKPGLIQFIHEVMAGGVPVDFQSPAPMVVDRPAVPVIVRPVHAPRKSLQKDAVLGQLTSGFCARDKEVVP